MLRDVQVVVRHSFRDGLTSSELFALVASARAGIHEMLTAWERLGQESRARVGAWLRGACPRHALTATRRGLRARPPLRARPTRWWIWIAACSLG